MDDLRGGSSVLRFSGGTPPRRRGDVRRVWLSPRHRRLCYLPAAGELGAASPDCVPATAVLGILGLLGPGVGAVLALTRASDPAPSLDRTSSAATPSTPLRGECGNYSYFARVFQINMMAGGRYGSRGTTFTRGISPSCPKTQRAGGSIPFTRHPRRPARTRRAL